MTHDRAQVLSSFELNLFFILNKLNLNIIIIVIRKLSFMYKI